MSVAAFPISEKYISITPPCYTEKEMSEENNSSMVENINMALDIIASNSIIHYTTASSLQHKMTRILCDWDFNYVENKSVLTELWHFFHSVEKKHIEFCDKRGCPTQCDCHSLSVEKRLRLDNWWDSFKTLVKTIDDRLDCNIVLCVKPRVVNDIDDCVYFVLTDLYLNMKNNTKYELLFNDIFCRIITENNERKLKNSPATFARIIELLEMIGVDDFKFVGNDNMYEEFMVVDFYEWWSKYAVFKRELKNIYKRMEVSL